MKKLDRYFDALRAMNWDGLADCLAENVHRIGPYLDVVHGKRAYVEFLSGILPKLQNYELTIHRIRWFNARSAVVELSETVDLGGKRQEFPEVLLFECDQEGCIERVDVYVKQREGSAGSAAASPGATDIA